MSVTAIAHPNIAFIKYWGKVIDDPNKVNWALNPSFSMTLSQARTTTTISKDVEFSFELNGEPSSIADKEKVQRYLNTLDKELGLPATDKNCLISSENNFPTAAGIASSASAFTALCYAYLGHVWGKDKATRWCEDNPNEFSRLCRLGSGSACRSIRGGYMYWDGSHAVQWESRLKLYDTVLILSSEKKKVSSRDGHRAASESPLLPERMERLPKRSEAMLKSLKDLEIAKDEPSKRSAFKEFGNLLEEEALEMHSLTQKAPEPVEYWTEDTRRVLKALDEMEDRNFYFTIDAGPNLHMISMEPAAEALRSLCEKLGVDAEIWEDHTGQAPRFLDDIAI